MLALLLCVSLITPAITAAELDGEEELAEIAADEELAATGAETVLVDGTVGKVTLTQLKGLFSSNYNNYGIKENTTTYKEVTASSSYSVSDNTKYTAAATSKKILGYVNWAGGTTADFTVQYYYPVTFQIIDPSGQGAVYLNNEAVSNSEVSNLLTSQQYTVTVQPVENYEYTISGAQDGVSFTPTASKTITVEYYEAAAKASVSVAPCEHGTAVAKSGGEEIATLDDGGYFTVETTPDADRGYELGSIVVTKDGSTVVEPNADGTYGPVAAGESYTVDVSFVLCHKDIELHGDSAKVNKSILSSDDYLGSYTYYGIAEATDPDVIPYDNIQRVNTTLSQNNNVDVEDGKTYFIFGTDEESGGAFGYGAEPVWDNAKVNLLTVRTYYNGSFAVTGCNAGAIYLNGTDVTGSSNVKLYHDTQYTVTAKDVEEYFYTIEGLENTTFTPSSDVTVTAAYNKDKYATFTLNCGANGSAEIRVNDTTVTSNRIDEGDSFTVVTTPNTDRGYKLDSIVVTMNDEPISPVEGTDNVFGPVADGEVYEITVSFKFDPDHETKEYHADNAVISSSNIKESLGDFSYYGYSLNPDGTDVTYLSVLNSSDDVSAGDYYIYGTNSGNILSPTWTSGKLMLRTVRTYYNGSFTLTDDEKCPCGGEIYLNNESVSGSVKLYTDTEYTVSATAQPADYTRTFTGATEGEAFTPSADVNVTVTYTANFEEGYYIVGNMNDWTPEPAYQLTLNEAAEVTEYMISDLVLTTTNQFKVVYAVPGGARTWIPDQGSNYGEHGEIKTDGTYTVYCRPEYNGGDDWFSSCLYVVEDTPEFENHSISLEGDIGVNFYVHIPVSDRERDDIKVVFTWNGNSAQTKTETVMIGDAKEKSGQFMFSCGVSAAEMNDQITAVLYYGNDEIKTDAYSVRTYADVILYDQTWIDNYRATHEDYDELAILVKTMLNYGAAAQAQFNHNTDNPANADIGYDLIDLTQEEKDAITDDIPVKANYDLSEYGVSYYGYSLLLKAETTLRFYFKIEDADKFDASQFTFGGVTGAQEYNAKYVYIEITGIAAKELCDAYNLSVGETALGNFSVLSYVKDVLGDDPADETTSNTVTALYRYHKAADEFFPE